jgi:hypothetical protein
MQRGEVSAQQTQREGKRMLYSLAGGDDVVRLLHALGQVGERNVDEIERVRPIFAPATS